jgi:hypothetical protein
LGILCGGPCQVYNVRYSYATEVKTMKGWVLGITPIGQAQPVDRPLPKAPVPIPIPIPPEVQSIWASSNLHPKFHRMSENKIHIGQTAARRNLAIARLSRMLSIGLAPALIPTPRSWLDMWSLHQPSWPNISSPDFPRSCKHIPSERGSLFLNS